MKRLFYVFVFSLFIVQSYGQRNLRLGIKAGLNMATVSGDGLDADFKIGHHLGGYAEFMLTDQFSFVPEMLFSAQGFEGSITTGQVDLPDLPGFEDVELPDLSTTLDQDLQLSYLNFPLMGRFYFGDFFFAEAGPQIGFLLGARLENSSSENVETTIVNEDGESVTVIETVTTTSDLNVRDRFNDIDFGINVGAGSYINDNFKLSLRYYLGLNEIDKDNQGFSNQVLMFSVGYRF